MTLILQTALPFAPWMDPRTNRLPGVLPLEGDDWLRVDEAFAAQMAERDRLLAGMPDQVHALMPQGVPAATELYGRVLARMLCGRTRCCARMASPYRWTRRSRF